MVTIIHDIIYVLFVYIFFDTIHGVQSGIIRGLGLQVYGSIYTLVCYYIFGMPLALTFAFKVGMGVKGLWLGFSIACIILDLGFWVIIAYPNWQKIAVNLRKRILEDEEHAEKIEHIQHTPSIQKRGGYTPSQSRRTPVASNKKSKSAEMEQK